jgi:hypothetical protein
VWLGFGAQVHFGAKTVNRLPHAARNEIFRTPISKQEFFGQGFFFSFLYFLFARQAMEPQQPRPPVSADSSANGGGVDGGAQAISNQNHHNGGLAAALANGSGVGRVENLLEGAVETLRQLSIIVEDYHEHQPPTFLFDKLYVLKGAFLEK